MSSEKLSQLPSAPGLSTDSLTYWAIANTSYKGTGSQLLAFVGAYTVLSGTNQVSGLDSVLASKANVASPTFTGLATIPSAHIQSHYGGWVQVPDAATVVLDMSLSDKFSLLASSAIGSSRIVSFANFTVGQILMLEFIQAASGGPYVLSWPSILWPSGIMPAPTTSPSKSDIFMVVRRSNGSYTGTLSIANY